MPRTVSLSILSQSKAHTCSKYLSPKHTEVFLTQGYIQTCLTFLNSSDDVNKARTNHTTYPVCLTENCVQQASPTQRVKQWDFLSRCMLWESITSSKTSKLVSSVWFTGSIPQLQIRGHLLSEREGGNGSLKIHSHQNACSCCLDDIFVFNFRKCSLLRF